jgi:hypothetical protein
MRLATGPSFTGLRPIVNTTGILVLAAQQGKLWSSLVNHKVASLRRHIRLTVVLKRNESAVRHAVGNRAETARGWELKFGGVNG